MEEQSRSGNFSAGGKVSKLQIGFLNKKSKKKSSFLTGFSRGRELVA
ncbi:hypothetical protein SLEP1_g22639 [Rubroshorea leprosula]|uniref:Ribosomal protein L32 n=1 Tax=Rubroshorea leprosula TaxID=152421 RepID=A0AAV5JH42_9ROSI|nr:hypothetical protein SLEP1_g22639 [Rubroshorea leprosula]